MAAASSTWLLFVPFAGYIAGALRFRRDNPDASVLFLLAQALENTLLYFFVGAFGRVAGVPAGLFIAFSAAVFVTVLPLEFVFARRWGDRLGILGWHRLQRASGRQLALTAGFAIAQSFSFLCAGYLLMSSQS